MKEQGKSGSVAEAGTLYVVATPIGNLEDMTLRALRILESVDTIAAEDTRHTRRLLTHHGMSKPLISYHDHNKVRQAPRLLEILQAEQSVALVTDAGTPGISDPAYYLIQLLLSEDIPIVPIPGPTAVIAALSVAGLPTDRLSSRAFSRLNRVGGSGGWSPCATNPARLWCMNLPTGSSVCCRRSPRISAQIAVSSLPANSPNASKKSCGAPPHPYTPTCNIGPSRASAPSSSRANPTKAISGWMLPV